MLVSAAKTALKVFGFDDNDPLNSWLDQAKNEVEEAFDWPFLQVITTVNTNAGSNTIILPADFFKIISVRNVTANAKLTYRDIVGFERDVDDPTLTGSPKIYTQTALGTLQTWPVPDTAVTYRVVYQTALADHGADGVACPGPARFHYVYVLGAAYIGLQADNEEDRSANAQQAFNASVSRLIRKYKANLDEPKGVVDVMGYGN